jgi:hypothetical protein
MNGLTPKLIEHDNCRKGIDNGPTARTPRMTFEWHDRGVKRVSRWSKAVRNAMLKGGAEFQRQKALNRAAGNWSKEFLQPRTQHWHESGKQHALE